MSTPADDTPGERALPERNSELPDGAEVSAAMLSIVNAARARRAELPDGFQQRRFEAAVAAGVLSADGALGNPRFDPAELDARMRAHLAAVHRERDSRANAKQASERPAAASYSSLLRWLRDAFSLPQLQGAAAVAMVGLAMVLAMRTTNPPQTEDETVTRGGGPSQVFVLNAKDPNELASRIEATARGIGLGVIVEAQESTVVLHLDIEISKQPQATQVLAPFLHRPVSAGSVDVVIVPLGE